MTPRKRLLWWFVWAVVTGATLTAGGLTGFAVMRSRGPGEAVGWLLLWVVLALFLLGLANGATDHGEDG